MDKDITKNIKKVINHLVLFKIKQDASPEQIGDFLKGLKSLRSIIGVIWAEGGKQEIMFPNCIDRSAGYNFMVLSLVFMFTNLIIIFSLFLVTSYTQ